MDLQIRFTDKELEDIIEALKLGSIHSQAPAGSDRMHKLTQKIQAVRQLTKVVK